MSLLYWILYVGGEIYYVATHLEKAKYLYLLIDL